MTLGVVDFVANDVPDLLAMLDGQSAETTAGTVVLHTQDSEVREVKPTLLNSFLSVLANPNLAFLLFVLGAVGLLVEAVSPGLVGPGVIGGLALALALLGFGHLPVNWVAIGLLLLAPGVVLPGDFGAGDQRLRHRWHSLFGVGRVSAFRRGFSARRRSRNRVSWSILG